MSAFPAVCSTETSLFFLSTAIGGSKEAPGTWAQSSRGPNSFNFMQFLGKNWPNNSFSHPPLDSVPPPRGNP